MLFSVGIENDVYHVNKEMYKIYKYMLDNGNNEEIDELNAVYIYLSFISLLNNSFIIGSFKNKIHNIEEYNPVVII